MNVGALDIVSEAPYTVIFSASSTLLLIPCHLFFISVSVSLISDWFFFMISISFFILLKFSLSSLSTFITIVFNSVSGILLASIHLVLFLEMSPILSFWTCFFVSPFWLLLCVCFYVLGRAATSPRLGRVALRSRHSVGFSGIVSQSPKLGAPSVPPVWIVCTALW